MRTVLRSAVVLASIIVLAACTASTEEPESEPAQSADQGLTACPAIAILCIQGYHAERRGQCRQVCVKDRPQCLPKCGQGSYCAECRTLDGVGYVCLPDGAVC